MEPASLPELVATSGPVLVIGTGLLGTSVALALVRGGVEVQLEDASAQTQALARDLGAGALRGAESTDPRLVVVATPPDVAGAVAREALVRFPEAVVTDVASVKRQVERDVLAVGKPLDKAAARRYVGSHPMAGGAQTGPAAADADLFLGRPWVVVPHADSAPDAILAVRTLATDLRAVPATMGAKEHDDAVALVSHVPQLTSSLLAGRLHDAAEPALGLAGQGLRDMTRIAASDPNLWASIIVGNAGPVTRVLRALREDLDVLIDGISKAAVGGPLAEGAAGPVALAVQRGSEGQRRIPGKHGGAPRQYASVVVLVPDEPGELGRLFSETGELRVNIEDLRIEHSAGQKVGLATISVEPAAARTLEEGLTERGWRIVTNG